MADRNAFPAPLIRPGTAVDMAAAHEIYAHHVQHGLDSFESKPPAADEMVRRRADTVLMQRALGAGDPASAP